MRTLSLRPLPRPGFLNATLGTLLVTFGAASWAQGSAEPVTVQRGDTFSSIAARFGTDLRQWRKLYDPQRSGLADPNVLLVGQKLELVSADGAKFLRVVGGAAKPPAIRTAASAAPTPAPAPMPAPVPKAAPPATAGATPAAAPAADDTLTIGLIPNIPAPAVLAQYEHLKRYLEPPPQI